MKNLDSAFDGFMANEMPHIPKGSLWYLDFKEAHLAGFKDGASPIKPETLTHSEQITEALRRG